MLIGLNEVHEQISKDEARQTRSYVRKMKKANAITSNSNQVLRDSEEKPYGSAMRLPVIKNERDPGDISSSSQRGGLNSNRSSEHEEKPHGSAVPLLATKRARTPLPRKRHKGISIKESREPEELHDSAVPIPMHARIPLPGKTHKEISHKESRQPDGLHDSAVPSPVITYTRKRHKGNSHKEPQKPGEPRDSAVPAATTRARTPSLRNKHKGREFGDTTKLKNCSGKIEKEYNVMSMWLNYCADEEEEEYEEPLIDKRRKQRPLKMDGTCPTHSCFRFRVTNLACDTKLSELRSEDKSAVAGLEKQSTIVLTDDDDDM
ncbi:hypothetical protein QJS04_geneDACA020088 [Acorus gramineus]|uniref:Uncharacterized protein n=1 Tax=Acorus gramineus TaxID=55184 RepID=A0AAV9A715_ACOGR|nr:hypothetical protein QJS04_geneDACA020088 [Acorus gramineus]